MQQLDSIIAGARKALAALNGECPAADSELLAARRRRDAEQRRRDIREAALARIPIPAEDVAAIRSGTLTDTHALRVAKRWLSAAPSPWLVLSGAPGTGKTLAAAYAAGECGGVYVTATELHALLVGLKWRPNEVAPLAHVLASCALLVIDDLGVETDSEEKFEGVFYDLLNDRQALRTIITTNLSSERLLDPARYGERVAERLRHLTTSPSGASAIVELAGGSMRRRPKSKRASGGAQ